MHVVIVGGGFGGVKAALELSKRQIGKVTLISDRPYFLHHATLYATATGRSTEESVIPLTTIFKSHPNVTIVEDIIEGFDPHRKLVSSQTHSYHYDKLILALGSVTSFHHIKGLEKHAYGIQSIEEVQLFHDHIYEEVVKQKLDKEYFVVGAGPTGVEVAGALTGYLRSLVELYRLPHSRPKVTLVEADNRILPHLSHTASRKVKRQLEKQGVRVLTNQKVSALDGTHITVDGKIYKTTTALWTSGLNVNPFYKINHGYFSTAADGRIAVNPFLEAVDDVYIIGDNAAVMHGGTALSAMMQATHTAKNITRLAVNQPQRPFRPKAYAIGIPTSESWAYVEKMGVYVDGRLGLWLRRRMELRGYLQLMPRSEALPIWRSHDVRDVDSLI